MSRWKTFLQTAPTDRVSRHNDIVHLGDDDGILHAIWDAIDEANSRIWMSMFILAPDEVGLSTLERLTEAARRGCEVLVTADGWASLQLKHHHVASLQRAGGRFAFFNPVWPPSRQRGRLTIRDHRKMLVIDDHRAFCGGFNLSEEFAGDDHGTWLFDDAMAYVEGPAADHLADVFQRTWAEVTGEHLRAPPPGTPRADGCPAAVLATDPRRRDTRLVDVLTQAIGAARDRCFMATPYFVPPPWLYDALRDAGARGVDVRVVTAGRTDRAVARLAGWHSYDALMRHGVRIFEMQNRILHAKTLAIDGQFASIGSYNMDAWTSRHCLDLNLLIADPGVTASVEEQFFSFVGQAHTISQADVQARSPAQRLAHRALFAAYRSL